MTIKQIQHLLGYLGYYTASVDGIWGSQSTAAATRFQQDYDGLIPDGIAGEETQKALRQAVSNDLFKREPVEAKTETGTFWDDSEFFDREEFRCQCKGKYCNGFPVEPEQDLVMFCNEFRRELGVPVSIVDSGGSGVRCAQHNTNVRGAKNSNHLYGKAADLHSEKSPQEMYRLADRLLGNTGELGLYDWGIHVAVNCAYSRFNG